jgi:hypothetical protein
LFYQIKTNTMKTTFEKQHFNEKVDHSQSVVEMFKNMGYSNIKVSTSLTNGLSHYVTLRVDVLNEGKCYAEMFVFDGKATIEVRISNHSSNLEKICGGVSGNKMTLNAFKHLVTTGAIANNN